MVDGLRRAGRVGLVVGCLAVIAPPAGAAAPEPGCALARPAVAHYPGATAATVPAGKRIVPCRYDTGYRSMEPSFGFTRDGRVLFQGWELRGGGLNGVPPIPVVGRSSADFTKWEDVSPLGPVTSLDPYLEVDERTGRVFSVNFLGTAIPNCATVSFSDDSGDSWTSTPAVCGGADGESVGAGPPVTSAPSGYPNIVYFCTGTTPASEPPATTPICAKSLDGGLTFLPTGALPWPLVDPDAQGDTFGPWAGNPVVGPDGAVYVPKRHGGQPEVAISHDEGLSWTRVKVASNGSAGQTPRIALDDRGNLVYAWAGSDHLPYVAGSRDKGRTWTAPLRLSPPELKEAALPWPGATGTGHVVVAYLGSTNAKGQAPYYEYCNYLLSPCEDGEYATVAWSGYMTVIDDLFAARPGLQTATVNPADKPLLIGGCSADGACKADLDFIDADFGPRGEPWAAFSDDCKLERDFTPVFGQGFGRCSDNVGEGIVVRLVEVTPAGTCARKRAIVVRVARRLRARARSFDVIVAGRIVLRGRDPRRGARIVLRGRPGRSVKVVLRVRLRSGRIVRDRRSYRVC